VNFYECTKCSRIFDNFPAANNHEKATGYVHLTFSLTYGTSLTELFVCSCGCSEVAHVSEALWDEEVNLAYVALTHMAAPHYEVIL
jgi:hypothetical protein